MSLKWWAWIGIGLEPGGIYLISTHHIFYLSQVSFLNSTPICIRKVHGKIRGKVYCNCTVYVQRQPLKNGTMVVSTFILNLYGPIPYLPGYPEFQSICLFGIHRVPIPWLFSIPMFIDYLERPLVLNPSFGIPIVSLPCLFWNPCSFQRFLECQ